ncbi:hypothetical protein ACROYT_G013490 [Oculina patagonica]
MALKQETSHYTFKRKVYVGKMKRQGNQNQGIMAQMMYYMSESRLRGKIRRITDALEADPVDVQTLKELSISADGLITVDLRCKVWNKLLNVNAFEVSRNQDKKKDNSELKQFHEHKYWKQVNLDVDRSHRRFPADMRASRRRALQEQLVRVIMRVLCRNQDLHYYQGYHDVAVTLLLVVGEDLATALLEQLSLHQLRDFMEGTMEKTSKMLAFLHPIIEEADPELEDFLIRKRRNRSSTSSGDETSPLHEAKKSRDLAEAIDESTSSEHEANDEIMDALNKIELIGEQLNSIIARLSKLDSIESSVRNIETNLANLKARTAKLEEFEATTKSDIAELKKSCTFNGDKCKERQDELKKKIEEQNEKIASLIESERKITAKMNDIVSKNLYLEAYSRRENIKYFNIPEAREEDTEEVLRNFLEQDLGYRNARNVEIQRVHRLTTRRNSDTASRPIIARFLRYKDVEEIFSLGRRLEDTDFQMFRDLPLEIIKRRKDQMAVFKEARRQGMRASFSKSQPDKLFVNGKFWPPGKRLDAADEADE